MIKDVEFNIDVHNGGTEGKISSYFRHKIKQIHLHYLKRESDDIAFKVLILDASHESMHAILNELENTETSRQYDNIGVEVESITEVQKEMVREFNLHVNPLASPIFIDIEG